MGVRTVVWQAVQVVAIVVVVALVAGQLLGQPILLSFVTSGSMEPTLEPGDGFVAVPPELAGSLGEGDVVIFEAEEVDGGGLTTHRIVGETGDGFLTQGDANPFTDQDGGEPPVQEPKVVAVAWQPGGEVVVVPGLGTAVTGIQSILDSVQRQLAGLLGTRALLGTQGIAYLLFGASMLLYVVGGWLEDDKQLTRNHDRDSGLSSRQLMLGLTLLLLAGATAAMVIPAGVHDFGIVSAEFESESPDVIRQGTSESFQYEVRNGGVVPTVVLLEPASPQVGADPSRLTLSGRSAENATVAITAPPETGYYQVYLEERRYFAFLPTPAIESLYELHPWLPILVIDLLIGVPFYLFGMRLTGTGRLRSRARDSPSGGFLR
jgi:signal peptidase